MTDVDLPPANAGPILGAEAYTYHAQWIAKSPELYQPAVRAVTFGGHKRPSHTRKRSTNLAQIRRDIKVLPS